MSVQHRLSQRLVLLLAVACGASVANLYYAQPLLHTIAADLGTSASAAALVVTASQLGYAAGLLFLVPLGDIVDRRRLVARMLIVAAIALGLAAAAPALAVLAVVIAIAGVTSTVAQVLVPFASQLAPEEDRGRVVGQVMSGLLIGILLARTFSGFIAALAGWRVVFVVAAVVMLVLATALWRALPEVAPHAEAPYGRLLASVFALIREQPALRRRMAYGGLGMASFTMLWTSLALLLSRPPYGYGAGVIGLFGLAGLAGAAAAQAGGRAADRGRARRATGLFLTAILLGWGLAAVGGSNVIALVAGIVVLDLGMQGQHILNQTSIFELLPEARSRLTTAYMTSNFLCGALSSAVAAAAWSAWGWNGICALGGLCAVLALALWSTEAPRVRSLVPSGASDRA